MRSRWGGRAALAAMGVVVVAAGMRSFARLPAWRDNRSQLLTQLAEHPEAYRAHLSAAAVLAGLRDTAGARREYRVADSLFSGDPHMDAARALYLAGLGDTAAAAPLVRRARSAMPDEPIALRAQFLLELARGDRRGALAVADSAQGRYPWERAWYLMYLQ
jgi:Tfp pilus assembly protein PilF